MPLSRLYNTKENCFLRDCIEEYLYIQNKKRDLYISFDEFLMNVLKYGYENKKLKENDIMKVLFSFEKLLVYPFTIRNIYEHPMDGKLATIDPIIMSDIFNDMYNKKILKKDEIDDCSQEDIMECVCSNLNQHRHPSINKEIFLRTFQEYRIKNKISPIELYFNLSKEQYDFLNLYIKSILNLKNEDLEKIKYLKENDLIKIDMINFELYKNQKSNSSEKVMNNFMDEISSGKLEKEICPQSGDVFTGSNEDVKSQLYDYDSLLNSGIVEAVTKEKAPVKTLGTKPSSDK